MLVFETSVVKILSCCISVINLSILSNNVFGHSHYYQEVFSHNSGFIFSMLLGYLLEVKYQSRRQ